MTETYEYAALLNNKAATLHGVKRYDEAEENWKDAIGILKKVGFHDGEIAISLVMLAHLTFDRDNTAYSQVEALLDGNISIQTIRQRTETMLMYFANVRRRLHISSGPWKHRPCGTSPGR